MIGSGLHLFPAGGSPIALVGRPTRFAFLAFVLCVGAPLAAGGGVFLLYFGFIGLADPLLSGRLAALLTGLACPSPSRLLSDVSALSTELVLLTALSAGLGLLVAANEVGTIHLTPGLVALRVPVALSLALALDVALIWGGLAATLIATFRAPRLPGRLGGGGLGTGGLRAVAVVLTVMALLVAVLSPLPLPLTTQSGLPSLLDTRVGRGALPTGRSVLALLATLALLTASLSSHLLALSLGHVLALVASESFR